MFVHTQLINGLMLGIEFLWDEGIVVVDLGIIRIYTGKVPTENNNNDE